MSFYNANTSTITAEIVHVKDKLIMSGPIVPSVDSAGVVVIQGTTQFQGSVQFQGSTVMSLTKAQADAQIAAGTLSPGAFYQISGADNTNTMGQAPLYNDGKGLGTTVVLQATSTNTFSADGYGIFWNPAYDQEAYGYGVWTNLNYFNYYNYSPPTYFTPGESITADNGATGQLFGTIETYSFTAAQPATWQSADFLGYINGATLTVTQLNSGYVGIGQLIAGIGVAPNTHITALGTGIGGVGTYTVSVPQSVSVPPMPALHMTVVGPTSIVGNSSGATASVNDISIQTYAPNSTTIWGGYVWTNLTGAVGTALDVLNLDDTNWVKNVYGTLGYVQVVDCIRYDYPNDKIVRRYELSGNNDVSYSFYDYQSLFSDWDYDPIAVFQFGNPSLPDSGGYGMNNNKISSSYVETVNFRGNRFSSNTFSEYSYFAQTCFENDSSIYNNQFVNDAGIYGCIFAGAAFAYNELNDAEVYYSLFVNDSGMMSNTYSDAWLPGNIFVDGSGIYQSSLFDAEIVDCWFQYDSGIGGCSFKYNYINFPVPLYDVGWVQLISGNSGAMNLDISSANVVYGNYAKNLILNSVGADKLTYIDGAGVLQVINTNA
jgi:hypothetical protein